VFDISDLTANNETNRPPGETTHQVRAGMTGARCCAQVAWLDHSSIPLTYEDRRVIDDTRFTVVRPYSKEWNLQIRSIQPEDQGQYRCTINTSPVKSKVIMLHVKGSGTSANVQNTASRAGAGL